MAIESVATTNQTTSSTSWTVSAPAGLATGDVVVAIIRLDSTSDLLSSISTETGSAWYAADNDGTTFRTYTWAQTVGATPPSSYTVSFSSAVAGTAILARASDADNRFVSVSAVGTGSSTSPAPGLFTASFPPFDFLSIVAFNGSGNSVSAYPGGLPDHRTQVGSGSVFSAVAADDNNTSSPSPDTWTLTNSADWKCWLVAVETTAAYTLTPIAGSYSLSGQATPVNAELHVTPVAGSYAVTGETTPLTPGLDPLTPVAGSYSLSGQTIPLTTAKKLTPVAGSYTLSGQTVPLTTGNELTPIAGTYTLTGEAVPLTHAAVLTPIAGSYVLSGETTPLTTNTDRVLTPIAGAYTLTGQTTPLTLATPTAYTLTPRYGIHLVNAVYDGLTFEPPIAGKPKHIKCCCPDEGCQGCCFPYETFDFPPPGRNALILKWEISAPNCPDLDGVSGQFSPETTGPHDDTGGCGNCLCYDNDSGQESFQGVTYFLNETTGTCDNTPCGFFLCLGLICSEIPITQREQDATVDRCCSAIKLVAQLFAYDDVAGGNNITELRGECFQKRYSAGKMTWPGCTSTGYSHIVYLDPVSCTCPDPADPEATAGDFEAVYDLEELAPVCPSENVYPAGHPCEGFPTCCLTEDVQSPCSFSGGTITVSVL